MDPSNTSFSLGSPMIKEPGKRVQVVSVEPLMSPNLEYLGAFTVWPTDDELYSIGGPGWPDHNLPRRHPLTEEIPAAVTAARPFPPGSAETHAPVSVSMGFRIRSGDIGALNGVRINYRVNGKMHHEFFAHAVIACVKPNPCDGPDDAQGRAWWHQVLYNFGLEPKPSD